jgi:outer membrane protein assembly factor BamB
LAGSRTESVSRLGTDGTHFTVNGTRTFLFGISYYGALGASDATVRRDLVDFKKHGFNWVRVWATWGAFGADVSAVNGEGQPRELFLKRLERLVAACDEQGIVVDVTLSRGNGSTGPARLQTLEAHRRAVATLITSLKSHRNWYLDLANERNIKDKRFTSFADLTELRELVRKLDPHRLVTASHAGDLNRADLGEYLLAARVDFLSPHRPRTAESSGQTEARSKEFLVWMKELGRAVPLHYQEPFRRDFGTWQPRATDYVTDLKGALAGGAAGWCWHNGASRAAQDGRARRSFDLREQCLFAQLDEEEARALPLLSQVIAEVSTGATAKGPAAGSPADDDWPQWRGPNRDGMFRATGLLEAFPASGLKVCWRAPAGWGFSSPVVAEGRVYLADSVVAKPQAKERVRCFAATTGKVLWAHAYEVAYEDWAFDPKHEVGPVATPIVRDDNVYTVGRVGHLFCLDVRKGGVLWQRDLSKDYHVAFAPGAPSPLIDGDLLILFIGGKPGACVIGLNKDTGKEVWRALDESLTFSSPVIISSGGKKQLIVWTQESVTSLDPATGTTWWRQRLATSSEYAVSTPVFHKDRLLVGGLMFQLDPDKPAAKVLWPQAKAPSRRIFSHTSTALFRGDHLFTARSSGELICVEAATAKQVWESAKVTNLKNGASIHVTQNGNSDLLYTDQGQLIRARLTAEGYHEVSRVALLEPTFPFAGRKVAWSPPAFAHRRVYVRSGKELMCASLAAAGENPATPAEQYQAILKDYQQAASGGDGTDEGRRKLIARLDELRPALAQRFLDLAEQYPADPVAVDALTQAIWMVNHNAFPAGAKDSPGPKAMAVLLRDYRRSDKLGPICLRINAGFRPEHETFLRTLLEKSPHQDVRGLACLALAQFLNNRLQRLDQIKKQPGLAREYDALFGKEILAQLRRQDRARVAREIETLFEQARMEYGDVKIPYEGPVAQKVKAELFEFRHLLVGKQAPDIEGVDQDGTRFKLSDYKAKVVLLDFWNEY